MAGLEALFLTSRPIRGTQEGWSSRYLYDSFFIHLISSDDMSLHGTCYLLSVFYLLRNRRRVHIHGEYPLLYRMSLSAYSMSETGCGIYYIHAPDFLVLGILIDEMRFTGECEGEWLGCCCGDGSSVGSYYLQGT